MNFLNFAARMLEPNRASIISLDELVLFTSLLITQGKELPLACGVAMLEKILTFLHYHPLGRPGWLFLHKLGNL